MAFRRNRYFYGALRGIYWRNFQNGRVLRLSVLKKRPSVATLCFRMPFDVECLDNAVPCDFAAKKINHRLGADMLRFAMVHRFDCLF